MKILLLCSAYNGLTQAVWAALLQERHDPVVHVVRSADDIHAAVAGQAADLILCPFLTTRIPKDVWSKHTTIVIHPGPVGDRGPSSLDWAITRGDRRTGVTALLAVDTFDAGPPLATRTIELPPGVRKSAFYRDQVTKAAVEVTLEVVARAADPAANVSVLHTEVTGRFHPLMRQTDRAFLWCEPTEEILRRINAADGSPGVRTTIAGVEVSVFDAHLGAAPPGPSGTIAAQRHGAVLVRTGDGALWIGHARRLATDQGQRPPKLPAALALGSAVFDVPQLDDSDTSYAEYGGHREIAYTRHGPVGILRFDFYNGAMSTDRCERLLLALRRAIAQDTSVLVLQGGEIFANGIDLARIEAARRPAAEGWANILAMNEVCRAIIECTHQLVITAFGGNAGAGGVMLGLGADVVVQREHTVLNPHYANMGLYGSEGWTYVLPRRVGPDTAADLTTQCMPVGSAYALEIGLVDAVLPGSRPEFDDAVLDLANDFATSVLLPTQVADKTARRVRDEQRWPLDLYFLAELMEMGADLHSNRRGFNELRKAFLAKRPAPQVPTSTASAEQMAEPPAMHPA